MSGENEFLKQFSGSAVANVVMIFAYGLWKFIQSHCKHSRCSSNNSCFKCSVDNDQTIRQRIEHNGEIRDEESMQELSTTHNQKVRPRRAELDNEGDFPRNKSSWLEKDSLFKKYKAIPLNKRRALSVAGVKGSQAYGVKNPKWDKALSDDVVAYKKERGKHKLSDSEKAKIPSGGFEALKKISTEFKRNIKNDLKRNDMKGLYSYSKYIVVRFYSEYAFRNDLATIQINTGENKLSKQKGIYEIEMKSFKASDKIGTITVKLSKAMSTVLKTYIKYRAQFDLKHAYLLVNSRGAALSKKGLGQILNQITKKYLGKGGFGTRIIRILKARSEAKTLDAAKKVANDMLHSLEQNQEYNKK